MSTLIIDEINKSLTFQWYFPNKFWHWAPTVIRNNQASEKPTEPGDCCITFTSESKLWSCYWPTA